MNVDFTKLEINKFRLYGGANGNKICVIYNGENYMLKFPPKTIKNEISNYTNSCISEYIACNIFSSLGIETQKVILGMYGDKIAVACKDFAIDGYILKDFASLKNTIIESSRNGYGTELEEILSTMKEQQIVPFEKLETFFWDMFIGDSLLGNFDRHNGNWGFLVNENMRNVKLAPVYDCGSCLYPQLDEKGMKEVLSSEKEIDERIYVFPNSAIKENDKKINYFKFLTTTEITECLEALKKIGSRIDLKKVDEIIENTPYVTSQHKTFLKTMIKNRKEKIIDKALKRIN